MPHAVLVSVQDHSYDFEGLASLKDTDASGQSSVLPDPDATTAPTLTLEKPLRLNGMILDGHLRGQHGVKYKTAKTSAAVRLPLP